MNFQQLIDLPAQVLCGGDGVFQQIAVFLIFKFALQLFQAGKNALEIPRDFAKHLLIVVILGNQHFLDEIAHMREVGGSRSQMLRICGGQSGLTRFHELARFFAQSVDKRFQTSFGGLAGLQAGHIVLLRLAKQGNAGAHTFQIGVQRFGEVLQKRARVLVRIFILQGLQFRDIAFDSFSMPFKGLDIGIVL